MRRAFRTRLRVISGIIACVAFFLVVRLYFVQVVHGQEYSLRAEHQYVSSSQELFDRGSIFFTDKDGTEISAATLATGFLVAIDPETLKDPEGAYAKIAAIVPALDRDGFMKSAAKTDDPYEVVAHHVDDDAGRAVDALGMTGVIVERERWRDYPAGGAAAQSVGIIAYDNDNSLAGRLGLERYYEDVLAHGGEGVFGNFFAELFANIGELASDPRTAQQGDVVTSIEPMVQRELDSQLAAVEAQYGSAQTGGIIMDPKTGEIYALDTAPSFDPNHFQEEDAQYFGNPLVEKRYEFGSIFKTMTMTSGLDAGVITPDTTYNDTGCIEVNKSRICNYDLQARGVIPMQEILSQSLNVGASFVATRLGHDRFPRLLHQARLRHGDRHRPAERDPWRHPQPEQPARRGIRYGVLRAGHRDHAHRDHPRALEHRQRRQDSDAAPGDRHPPGIRRDEEALLGRAGAGVLPAGRRRGDADAREGG